MNRNRYQDYEQRFDPLLTDRKARRKRKPKAHHTSKKAQEALIQEIADVEGHEVEFETTYQPSLYEAEWLLSSLRNFYEQSMITDVLALVKGGKEASVYRCTAHHSTGKTLLAAKVYRPHKFRTIRNDTVYKQGRDVLTSDGKAAKKTDHRLMRALGKKSSFGLQVAHTSWLMHEFTTLKNLYLAGAAVPEPIACAENAILMSYHGDEAMPAPLLSEVRLDREEAAMLFNETLRNIELMLSMGLVHGDLSAYNILYWEGDITLIDFPQVIYAEQNSQGYDLFLRDVTRICEYFARQGVVRSPEDIAGSLWRRFINSPMRWTLPEGEEA